LSQEFQTTAVVRQDVKKTYDWNMKTIDLLSDVTAVLSKSIKDGKKFNAGDGDVAYFSDLQSFPKTSRAPVQRSLCAIKRTFEELENLQEGLLVLEKSCSNHAGAVSHSFPKK
jgi:hypothetical protein